MAEQRAAKKASRHRWDPPRKARSTKDAPRTGSPFARNSRDGCLLAGLSDEDLQATDLTCDVIWDPDPHVLSPENAAAESLLFLHAQQAKANPGVCQPTHSSEPEKSSNSGPQPSWMWLAPNYDSRTSADKL
ncbi:hypothetical protein B0H13DRAFT_1884430 [Mycena leptocephala]|nr:hypothetical protein B0H13DRAFT_1884430 [Mycena leptocephala]